MAEPGLSTQLNTSKQHLVNLKTSLKLPLPCMLRGSCTLAFALPVSEAGAMLGPFQSWLLRKCPQLSLSTWLWGLVLLRVVSIRFALGRDRLHDIEILPLPLSLKNYLQYQ
uniref:SOCS box domain-containing protein n=1 Tax=Pavo cristatus TaxID=9049 RepID=A0A8C9FJR1_PAVCR